MSTFLWVPIITIKVFWGSILRSPLFWRVFQIKLKVNPRPCYVQVNLSKGSPVPQPLLSQVRTACYACVNLDRHVKIMAGFGVRSIVTRPQVFTILKKGPSARSPQFHFIRNPKPQIDVVIQAGPTGPE